MSDYDPKYTITKNQWHNGKLSKEAIAQIKECLNNRGFILLASDTCYSIATLPIYKEVFENLNLLIGRPKNWPISLAFPNLEKVEQFTDLHLGAAKLLEDFTPGPITVVCKAKTILQESLIEKVIRSTDGTIGVRIPDSTIEQQVANCTPYPITTTAIRIYDVPKTDGRIIQDFQEALNTTKNFLKKRNGNAGFPSWIAVEGDTFSQYHSTVVHVNKEDEKVVLLREGNIPFTKIQSSINRLPDWTFNYIPSDRVRALKLVKLLNQQKGNVFINQDQLNEIENQFVLKIITAEEALNQLYKLDSYHTPDTKKKNINDLKKEWKDSIKYGEIEKVIEDLNQYSDSTDNSSLNNSIILLSSKWHNLLRDRNEGIIDRKDSQLESNKLIKNLITLINSL